MRWACCYSDTTKEVENDQYEWPTAIDRAEAARRHLEAGDHWMTTSHFSRVPYLIDKETAKDLLKTYEDCRLDDDDDDDDDSESYPNDKNVGVATKCLHKPQKTNQLLAVALTNVNGDDWRRQRPLIAKAFADPTSKKIAAEVGCAAAIRILQDCDTIDARALALEIAVESISAAVFSKTYAPQVHEPLKQFFLPSLLPIRQDPQRAQRLRHVVEDIVALLHKTTTSTPCCLATSLLAQMEGGPRRLLSLPEVIGNCHSALMAGTQTICTTLTGAFAHTAELLWSESDEQATMQKAIDPRHVCMETLRILPPVAALPRYSRENIPFQDKISSDQVFIIDLLAFAHGGEESWKFRLKKQDGKQQAAPWGIGDRICPAGNLSVQAIQSVLQHLITQGFQWKLSVRHDSTGDSGTDGWIQHVRYTPTLIYPNPILLTFQKSS